MVVKKRGKVKKVIAKKLRKSSKKYVKKSNNVGKNNNSETKKKFEIFAQGIDRLKQLEQELNSLDTSTFSKEEGEIRKRLKSVSEIPYIEVKLKELRKKIKGKYQLKTKKYRKLNSTTRKLREDVKEIKEEELPEIKRGIKSLSTLKKDVPEMSDDIKELSSKIGKITKKRAAIIDTGVGVLVDTNFKDFLGDIKTSLSQRIQTKEKEMDDILSQDLMEREEIFRDKYGSLVREFNAKKRKVEEDLNKKYNLKVKSTLQKEVSEKFNYELNKKINAIKVALGKRYKEELKLHAQEKLRKEEEILKQKVQAELDRLHMMEGKVKIKEQDVETRIKTKLRGEIEKIDNMKFLAEREKKKMQEDIREKLRVEEEKLRKEEEELRAGIKDKMNELENIKLKLSSEKEFLENKTMEKIKEDDQKVERMSKNLEQEKKRLISKTEEERNRLISKTEEERNRLISKTEEEKRRWQSIVKERLTKESHEQMAKELAFKESQLRAQLKREFETTLKQHIMEHEEMLKKKKLALELEVQKKMRTLLK